MTETESRRTQAVLQLILDGAEVWDVEQFIEQKRAENEAPWTGEISTTPAELIIAAKLVILESYPDDDEATAIRKAQLRNLYARAVQAGDLRAARQLLGDLAKLERKPADEKAGEAPPAPTILRRSDPAKVEAVCGKDDASTAAMVTRFKGKPPAA